jgi:hypothetical protein
VRLGAGTFTAATNLGFLYTTGGNGNVAVFGQGQGQTTLTMPPDNGLAFNVNEALYLTGSGAGSSVSDLSVALPAPTPPNTFGSQYRGIVIDGTGQIHDATVTAPPDPRTSSGSGT